MIVTAKDMYEALLHELRAENTASVTPSEFNYHINAAMLQWLQSRFFAMEETQKHIDDLEKLLVRTNGVGGAPQPLINQGEAKAGKEYFLFPSNAVFFTDKAFLINVQFEMSAHPCYDNQSKLIGAKIKKMDTVSNDNAYDLPNNHNLFYYQADGKIFRYDVGMSSTVASKAVVVYIRMPQKIGVNEITGESVSNPEFDPRVNLEIVKWAVRSLLENLESPRQNSFAAEQAGVNNLLGQLQKR